MRDNETPTLQWMNGKLFFHKRTNATVIVIGYVYDASNGNRDVIFRNFDTTHAYAEERYSKTAFLNEYKRGKDLNV